MADRDDKPSAQEPASENSQASAQAPPDPPASTPTMLADGDLQMSTIVASRGRVMAAGFRNAQGGSNVKSLHLTRSDRLE
ncbi:hypothetical protein NW754_008713 [Fusarium falciforme]|uniref:Uncharacterized protein n=1 Tax=Fusarium falciforme TaxID=195108 RepID=A0A9W8V5P1_9HYPO|nr:hypothetical protein NW754_008713 [Fusarium falciforme]KAJ4193619.1 hypothetical protein NW755_003613 [Fusarium falciforme]